MTNWPSVGRASLAGAVYLALLTFLPGLEAVGWAAVPLVLATGLVAGAVAGLEAGGVPGEAASPAEARSGAWHGLLAGNVAGWLAANALVYVFSTNLRVGVFHGLNYEVAVAAGQFRFIATHGDLVVAGLAGLGWFGIAALGLYAGREASKRDSFAVVE